MAPRRLREPARSACAEGSADRSWVRFGAEPRLGSAARSHRSQEAVALALEGGPIGREVGSGGEEVLSRRVLLQAPHEVADRHIELVRAHDRHVQQHVTDLPRDRGDLALRHAQQHLELESVAHPALAGEEPRVGDVEEVVPGDADADGRGGLRAQRRVEAAEIVRVGVHLGVVGRQRPAVHDRIHPLHGEVGALDQPDLDGRAAGLDALPRPRRELFECSQRIGQIRLQHDPRLELLQSRVLEEPHEDGDGEVEVAVLLHVEVDEGLIGRRRLLRT